MAGFDNSPHPMRSEITETFFHKDIQCFIGKNINEAWVAYIGVPLSNIVTLFHDEYTLECHGGITYTDSANGCMYYGMDFAHAYDYYPLASYLHGDEKEWSIEEVRGEVKLLAEQFNLNCSFEKEHLQGSEILVNLIHKLNREHKKKIIIMSLLTDDYRMFLCIFKKFKSGRWKADLGFSDKSIWVKSENEYCFLFRGITDDDMSLFDEKHIALSVDI